MLRISFAAGIVGALALSACGSSNDAAINGGGGASGMDGGNASGGASAGASGGGNTSMAGGGGASNAGAGGTPAAGSGGAFTAGGGATSTGGGNSSAGAGGRGNGGANGGGAGGASGGAGNGGSSGDGGVACVRGVECTGFPATFVRGCTNDDSCVGEVHQTDCCGALRVMGMNHSEAATFCPAERTACRSQYANPPGCTSDAVVTDTGNTGSLDNVATRCADINQGVGTCTTFVCGTGTAPACPPNRHIGTCG